MSSIAKEIDSGAITAGGGCALGEQSRGRPRHGESATEGGVRTVLIVGGGLAGMAAAIALESAGARVTLLEARRTLGGRAGSFEDPRTGEVLDNCQHVLLGCCTNLLDFYRRLGVRHLIRFERAIRFVDRAGNQFALTGTHGLPAPLHLGPSMLRFGALTWRERLALSRAMTAMLRPLARNVEPVAGRADDAMKHPPLVVLAEEPLQRAPEKGDVRLT